MTGDSDDLVPELVISDQEEAIVDLLRELQRAALVHPEAAKALYGSLVSEGRLFSQTAAGRHWKDKVLGSALLERALLAWQNATLWMTEEAGDPGTTPSALIDAVVSVAASPRRDVLLDRLFRDLEKGI